MRIKGIIDEDFVNYKKPSMTIMFPYCDFKCDKASERTVCQNSSLAKEPNIEVSIESLIERYLKNNITSAIVMQGLEPFNSWVDLFYFIICLREMYKCDDDIVIYTGYEEDNDIVQKCLKIIWKYIDVKNIIVKYGRFIPDQKPHYDEVLGVNLASDNQYAKRYN